MNLKVAPFFLNDHDIKWIDRMMSTMTLEEKIGQLFCPIGYSTNPDYLKNELLSMHIGGLFFRNGKSEEMRDTFEFAQNYSKIPLLIPSNLEVGGFGAATDGTYYSNPLGIAASGDVEDANRLGIISADEGKALGINWTFAPVVDIDFNPYNPITNTRTYGKDPDMVYKFSKAYMTAVQSEGVAATLKHFPGDGIDDRDQHLLTSVNNMSEEEWFDSYGKIYKKLITDGSLTVMAGHIALPNFVSDQEKKYMPASLSDEILKDLLREKLAFNGLIVTDATPMIGFTAAMPRWKSVPLSIENGCDMFLFNKDLKEDYQYMFEGYKSGILSEDRLNEANYRVLALKASLNLHHKKVKGQLVPDEKELAIVGCNKHKKWTKEIADKSVTLVKDDQSLLPINPKEHRRILLQVLGDFPSNERVLSTSKSVLESQGFNVTVYEKENFENGVDNVETFKSKYDLVIYFGNIENASNRTTNRINWYTFFGQGNNVPWFVEEVPTLFISLANPYHLLDVPMIKTYINGYSNTDEVIHSSIEKILGLSKFKGISPIDPFCGRL